MSQQNGSDLDVQGHCPRCPRTLHLLVQGLGLFQTVPSKDMSRPNTNTARSCSFLLIKYILFTYCITYNNNLKLIYKLNNIPLLLHLKVFYWILIQNMHHKFA